MEPLPRTTIPYTFGGKKRLQSRDRVWIVTDVESFTKRIFDWAEPQRWYRAGGLDLHSNHLVIVEWTVDDMKAILKAGMAAGVSAPPWRSPMQHGFELTRFSHGNQESGRFREKVDLIDLAKDLLKQGPSLRRHFETTMGLQGNVLVGSLRQMTSWAARENAIATVALSFSGWFSAGDVKTIVGKSVNVTRTLARMVEDGILVPNGKAKRGAKYMKAPVVIINRADWTR